MFGTSAMFFDFDVCLRQEAGFFVSVVVLWAAVEEFSDVMKKGRTMDKWFAGTQLVIAALSTVAFAVQLGAGIAGEAAAGVAAIAGTLGMGMLPTRTIVFGPQLTSLQSSPE